MTQNEDRAATLYDDPFWHFFRKKYVWATGDETLAEDLTQELRIRVLRWIGKNGQPNHFRSFVWTVYGTVLTDWLREKQRNREDALLVAEQVDGIPAPAPSPEEMLHSEQWRERVQRELDRLVPGEMKRALLTRWDDPAEEVARDLKTTPAAVRTYRHKLRQRLERSTELLTLLRLAPGW